MGAGENDLVMFGSALVEPETIPELMPFHDKIEKMRVSEKEVRSDDGGEITASPTLKTCTGFGPL